MCLLFWSMLLVIICATWVFPYFAGMNLGSRSLPVSLVEFSSSWEVEWGSSWVRVVYRFTNSSTSGGWWLILPRPLALSVSMEEEQVCREDYSFTTSAPPRDGGP